MDMRVCRSLAQNCVAALYCSCCPFLVPVPVCRCLCNGATCQPQNTAIIDTAALWLYTSPAHCAVASIRPDRFNAGGTLPTTVRADVLWSSPALHKCLHHHC